MKFCKRCEKTKPLDNFAKQKSRKDGRYPYCRSCERERELKYRRSKDGLVANIYSNQISNSGTRGMNPPKYDLSALKEWCFSQKLFQSLYDDWVSSGYDRRMAPSCDRLDNSKEYSLDNIELVTFKENERRYKESLVNGEYTQKNSRTVVRVLNGEIVERFNSAAMAIRKYGDAVSYHLYQKRENVEFFYEEKL